MGVFQSNVFQNNVFQGPHYRTVDAGSGISGGYYSRGKWTTLLRNIEQERRTKRRRRAEHQALAPLEQALRELIAAEERAAAAEHALTVLHTRSAYNKLQEAIAKINELTALVEQLQAQQEADKSAAEAAQAEAERKAQQDAAIRGLLDSLSQQHAASVTTGAQTAQSFADQLAAMQRHAQMTHIGQQSQLAAQQAAIEDENQVLTMLMELL